MVTLTKTVAEILIPSPPANISTGDMVTLFEEIEAAVDRAYLVPPAATGATLSVTAADFQKLFTFSGAAAVALPEVGDLPAGFMVRLKAGAGALTITPFSGDTIGGAASLVLAATESVEIFGDGSGDWATIRTAGLGTIGTAAALDAGTSEGNVVTVAAGGRLPALDGSLLTGTGVGAEPVVAANSSSLPWTWDGAPVAVEIHIDKLLPVTDGAILELQFSTDGGGTWKVGASDYAWGAGGVTFGTTNTGTDQDDADDAISLALSLGVAAGERGASGHLIIHNPGDGNPTTVSGYLSGKGTNGAFTFLSVNGTYLGTDPVTGVRLKFSSGNIASGVASFRLIPEAD